MTTTETGSARPDEGNKMRAPEDFDTILNHQRFAFRAKFGREPGPNDPFFFNPDADEPEPITDEQLVAGIQQTLQAEKKPLARRPAARSPRRALPTN